MSHPSYEDAYQSGYGAGSSNYGGNVLYPLTSGSITHWGVGIFFFALYMAFAHPETLHLNGNEYRIVYGGFLLYVSINLLRYGLHLWYRWRWNQYYKTGSVSFCVKHYRSVGWVYNLIPGNPIYTVLAIILILWKRDGFFNPNLWIGHLGFAEFIGTALAGFIFIKMIIFILQVIFRGSN